MRWPASPNTCAEAPRLLTLAAGRGLGGRGRGWEVAQGGRQALPGWHRRLWSVRRRGARRLRRVHRRGGAVVRTRDRRIGAFLVGVLGVAGLGDALGGPFGGFVSSALCLGGLFGRDRGRCPRLERASRALRSRRFVRRRGRRASVDEGTAVADARSAARRAPSALLARGSGRRGSGPWSSEVVFVIGCQGGRTRGFTVAQVTQRGGAWSRHWRPVGIGCDAWRICESGVSTSVP